MRPTASLRVLAGMQLHVLRVATEDNIADLPSRLDFELLERIGAVERTPRLDGTYMKPETWQVLQERWQL